MPHDVADGAPDAVPDASPDGAPDGALERWGGEPVAALRAAWAVPALHAFRSTGSTNDVARRLAGQGAAHGTTVVADHQTGGRGRHGRTWTDRPGDSLLLSMVLRPADGADGRADGRADAAAAAGAETGTAALSVLPLLAGLACVRALRLHAHAAVRIEWPNDLVVDDRKLGGVLCDSAFRSGSLDFVVVGVGINLGRLPDELDADTRARALAIDADRRALAGDVARGLFALRADARMTADDLAEIRRLDALAGRRVRLGSGREGVAVGILPDGALDIRDGAYRFSVRAGSVSPLDAAAT